MNDNLSVLHILNYSMQHLKGNEITSKNLLGKLIRKIKVYKRKGHITRSLLLINKIHFLGCETFTAN